MLLIEPHAHGAFHLTDLLDHSGIELLRLSGIDKAAEYLRDRTPDAILLDLSRTEEPALVTFAKVSIQAPDIPLIALGTSEQEDLLIRTVHQGARDYLLLDQLHPTSVARTVRHAIEHNRAERARRESESYYRSLFEQSLDPVLITSLGGQILDANPAFVQRSGYTEDELLRLPLERLYVDPEDRRRFLQQLEATGSVHDFEGRFRRKDGTILECLVAATLRRDAEGTPIGVQTIIRDMTPRKRLERELVAALTREQEARAAAEEARDEAITILESIKDAFLALDREWRFTYLNEAARRFARKHLSRDPETLIGQVLWEMAPDLIGTRFEREYRRVMAGRIAAHFEEFHPGWGVWFDMHVYPARDGISIYFQDTTQRKQMEEQLRVSQKLEAVGRLTAGIAHDFNNLLGVILGNGQLLAMELPEGSPEHEDVLEITRAGERAVALVRQLLAFSRKQNLEPRVLDLNGLAAEVTKMLDRVIHKEVEIVTALDPAVGRVEADPGQLHQVVMNLMINARDAMPQGGRLTIDSSNAELTAANVARFPYAVKPGSYVRLRVRDTGIGMDRATQEKIFEPFFTTKERGEGTGLGLSTVYGIVKQSGGYIWVESEAGKGTVFEVYLPRVEEMPKKELLPAPAAREPQRSASILIVEDEEPLRRAFRKTLERSGYTVVVAGNGEEALEAAEQFSGTIDLVITDVMLPGMKGDALVKRLSERSPHLKALYISGYADDVLTDHGVGDAGVSFLQKPFLPQQLVEKLREVLAS